MVRWAMHSADAYHAAVKAGAPTDGLDPPEMPIGLYIWYEDFLELSTDRQIGMAMGTIPKSSIDAHVVGWPDEDAQMFRACIRAMDGVYLGGDDPVSAEQAEGNSARDAFRASSSSRRKG